jgi:hypothetical protein
MVKLKVVAYGLIALLIVAVAINVSQYNQLLNLSDQNDTATAQLGMIMVLTQAQTQIDSNLRAVDAGLKLACAALSNLDLQSSQARAVLSDLFESNSFIVNVATADINDTLLAVAPSSYRGIEGLNMVDQAQNIQMHATMRPAMSNMFLLLEGFYGVVMVAPIFNGGGMFVGSLSVVIQPREFILGAITPALEGTSFSMWAMQVNGTLLYDPDPVQEGKNLFTDPIYIDNLSVQAFVRQVADSPTGYGGYTYHQDTVVGQVVNKEAFWATSGIYGAEWRLVILNVLDANSDFSYIK